MKKRAPSIRKQRFCAGYLEFDFAKSVSETVAEPVINFERFHREKCFKFLFIVYLFSCANTFLLLALSFERLGCL